MRYLEHYAKVSRLRSPCAELKDVNLKQMTIVAAGRSYDVAFQPPLSTFNDIRERVIQMDQESITALNRSPITVKKYTPPTSLAHLVTLFVTVYTLLMYCRKDNLLPGSGPYELIFKHFPRYSAFALRVRPIVFPLMIAIHIGEALYMTRRLEKHSVPLFSRLWWLWVVDNLMEGWGAHQR
jgi:hypothetical protein